MGRQLGIDFRTWGGRRAGAGRPARDPKRRSTPHRARPAHYHGHPVHLTLRAVRRAPHLRAERPFLALRAAIGAASREEFRVIHFSVQRDHVHLIVEARDREALSSGARGLAVRLARAVNRRIGRKGALWGDRWNGRDLKTPREVRNAIVYVLANFKKHERDAREVVDPCSSAPWFDGFADAPTLDELRGGLDPPVRGGRTWLGAVGWRRVHGLVRVDETPPLSRRRDRPSRGRGSGGRGAPGRP
jgi:REP element-mobilizing transposase RayT